VSATNLHSVCTSRLDDSANSSTTSVQSPSASSHVHASQLSGTSVADRLSSSTASLTNGTNSSSSSVTTAAATAAMALAALLALTAPLCQWVCACV
jgi:hypothetical protein